MNGTRRSYVIRPGELDISPVADGLRFQFTLPSGVYATILLREFMKSDDLPSVPEAEDGSDED
jgi:tRNA pseudouridine13 synthase